MSKWVDRFEQEGNVDTRPRSGRPRVTTQQTREAIVNVVQDSGFNNAVSIRRNLQLDMSVDTVRRVLHTAGFHARHPASKPMMRDNHRVRRLAFAQEHLAWNEEWRQTVFVDEKIFTTDENGRVTLWRQRGTRYQDRNILYHNRQGRVTVSVWGSMTAQGVGDLVIVDERMNSEAYLRILRETMYPSAVQWFPEGMIHFVQDNSGPHRGRIVLNWLNAQERIHLLDWPAISPDLNPIEHVWARMQQRWDAVDIGRGRQQLINSIFLAWAELANDQQFFANLVESMPRRLQAVIDNNGGATRY